ncbi:hypothetical protein PISMIDRAFT_18866 [Pisolithus microcarpus 441]|uniref:Uncharacterized protein n=1 Tax=Pisolithus microcarpus 441 TaxID=765257 RepID=A0A0C9YWI1_9AGAM|nr:hypothetical protein PISMIDRAFT_18866 [Pisolithus microcarpus 441]
MSRFTPNMSRAIPDNDDQHALGSDNDGPCTTDIPSQSLFSFDHSPQGFYPPISSNPDVSHRGAKPSEDELKRLKLWAEKVACKFELKPTQFSELGMLIYVGKNLDTGDLRSRIWQQATNYKVLNGIEEIKVDLKNMKSTVEAVTSRLKGSFELSVDQMMQVTIMCKDMLVQAGRTKYKALHTDVEERLRSHADTLGFQNVFGNFGNKQVLRAAIKRECSAIRSKFRTLLLESTRPVDGKPCMTLEELTWTVLSKYKQGGVGSGSKAEYQLHFAYLRYYARAHQYIHPGLDASEASGIESGEEPGAEPPAKRAKTVSHKAPPGRVKTGRDFWSAMDRLLVKDLDQYGKDMKNDQWRDFFIEIVLTDQERYGKNSGTLLPSLPMTYTESHVATPGTTSETIPRPLPATTYHGPSHMQSLGHRPVTGASLHPSRGDSLDSLPATDGTEELLGEDF